MAICAIAHVAIGTVRYAINVMICTIRGTIGMAVGVAIGVATRAAIDGVRHDSIGLMIQPSSRSRGEGQKEATVEKFDV
jgi:hypothetical protein